tara:strand:+ start:8059 stop:9399 length:1341 start_codon:yes stop_codon:yes gene_type:complete
MANQITSKGAEPSFIDKIDIVSNKNQSKNVSVAGGTIRLMYYESILQDSIKATITFADTGNSIDNKTVIEGLPMVGQEKVFLKFRDNNEQTLDLVLYINKVTPLADDTTKSMVQIDLASKEFIMNEKVRLNTRFDGKISDHIKKILTDQNYLGTEKNVDIEETSNNYNFIGNNKKPYYAMNWLSKRAVPNLPDAKGNTAGYFFFETSEGFKFKSIDSMLSQEKKKSIIYNQTPDSRGTNIPAGYDVKALDYSKDNRVDVQEKLKMGAFSTRTVLFDPFNCYYEVITPNAKEKEKSLKLAGKELCVLNPEFNKEGPNKEFSRTTYMLLDKGTLPVGDSKQQIEKSTEENFDPKNILNQAIMRYNQLYSIKTTITIPGDFSLHAGDVVFIDAPELAPETKEVSKENGGLYIIADLCHYISPKETYTKLNLVRDSFGRIGNHTSGKIPL